MAADHFYKTLPTTFSNHYILQNTVLNTTALSDDVNRLASLPLGELFDSNMLPWISDSYLNDSFDSFLKVAVNCFFKHKIIPDDLSSWNKLIGDSKINLTTKLKFYDLTNNEQALNATCQGIISKISIRDFSNIDTIHILAKKGFSDHLNNYIHTNKEHLKAAGINPIESLIVLSYYNARWDDITKLDAQHESPYTNAVVPKMIRQACQRTNVHPNHVINYQENMPRQVEIYSSLSENTPLSSDNRTRQLMTLPHSHLNEILLENNVSTLTNRDRLFLEHMSLFDFVNDCIDASNTTPTTDKLKTLIMNNELDIAEQLLKQNLKNDISGYQSILLLALIKHHQLCFQESNDYIDELHHRIGKNQKTLFLKATNYLNLYQKNSSTPYYDESIAAFNDMSFIDGNSIFVASFANKILNVSSITMETQCFSDTDKQKKQKTTCTNNTKSVYRENKLID